MGPAILKTVIVLATMAFTVAMCNNCGCGGGCNCDCDRDCCCDKKPECEIICYQIYRPVCGFSCRDCKNITFSNDCYLRGHNKCYGGDYFQICNSTCEECGGVVFYPNSE